MHTPAVAAAYAAAYTTSQLESIRLDCLEADAGAGEISKSFGGGSMTINLSNVETVLENIAEALRIKASGATDPELTAEPYSSGVSFANRYIE